METATFVLVVLLVIVTGLAGVFYKAMTEWHDLAADLTKLNDKILAQNREMLDYLKDSDQEENRNE